MERLRFTTAVVGQVGTIEEIISRSEIGRRRKEAERGGLQELIEIMPEEIEATYPNILAEEYRLDFTEPILPEDKRRIFLPGIKGMEALAQRHGFALPADLLSRIYILDEDTCQNIARQETGIEESSFTAMSLPNKLCIINYDQAIRDSKRDRIGIELYLRELGIHEIWHSVSYEQIWIPPSEADAEEFEQWNLVRRNGITTLRPPGVDRHQKRQSFGLNRLNEGFTQYLTRESQRLARMKSLSDMYKNELEVVDAIAQVIGEEPFFQAMLTKNGFRGLFLAFERTFGKFAFYQELEKRYLALEFPYTVQTFRSMVKKWGVRAVLRNRPDLYKKYLEGSALLHIAGLMAEEYLLGTMGEKTPKYERTLRFINEWVMATKKEGRTILLAA